MVGAALASLLAVTVAGTPGAKAEQEPPRVLEQIVAVKRTDWATVSKRFPNTPSWNPTGDAPVGRSVRARTTYRSFFRMDLRPLAGATVQAAMLEHPVVSAVSCDTPAPEVWATGDIDAATTWKRQPAWLKNAGPTSGTCSGHWLEADLAEIVRDAVAAGQTQLTLGIRAADESDPRSYKTLSNTPIISVTYNKAPDKPTALSMLSHFKPCGPDRMWVSQTAPQLNATITDPDRNETGGGDLVTGRFEWWRPGGERIGGAESWTGSSGANFSVTVPEGQLKDGETYAWRVQGYDYVTTGPWSDWCEFTVDATRPDRGPTVTSDDYPPTGEHGGIGIPGTFTFTANGVDDIVEFHYGDSPDVLRPVPADRPGGSATVTYTPVRAGWQSLYVRGVDRAGNPSPIVQYEFTVAWPAAAGTRK
ncbi:hypothetical protein Arub01_15540 [Actinomadura rubrobrunea]|uniref:DNRLRE domain-containing protein n=1 Tax=Actinomadura rubrobrunea TaxID=115335 RepID=A0A9W6PRS6_9ACTN|nr:hypothetical protein Arub01_15540 [Actinomadura rubrobrunea]